MDFKKVNKLLTIVILFLCVIIIFGTIGGIALKKTSSNKSFNNIVPQPTQKEIESLNKRSSEKIAAYTGIGRIRVVTLPEENEDKAGTPVVITPWFSYSEENIELYEELSKKRLLFIGIITNYFSEKTEKQLLTYTEEKIKADLLTEINNQLVLGKIENLFFTEFIFLD